MSSAANHIARSHRSQGKKIAAMHSVQRYNAYNSHYFDNPIPSLLRKLGSLKESKLDKV